jgi:hypothetical protein
MATTECVDKGAWKTAVKVIFQELVALPYLANKLRAFVQVVGDLGTSSDRFDRFREERETTKKSSSNSIQSPANPKSLGTGRLSMSQSRHNDRRLYHQLKDPVAIDSDKPKIDKGEWLVSEIYLEFLQIGTYILGCTWWGITLP